MSLLLDNPIDENTVEKRLYNDNLKFVNLLPVDSNNIMTSNIKNNNYVKLSPISAKGIFSKYNISNNKGNNNCKKVLEDIPFKKFKNPFVNKSNDNLINELKINNINNESFTTMSLFSYEKTFYSVKEIDEKKVNLREVNKQNEKNNNETDKIDKILKLAKKIMGDELIKDLLLIEEDYDNIANSNNDKPKQDNQIQNITRFQTNMFNQDKENLNKEFNIEEFVDEIIQRELTITSISNIKIELNNKDVNFDLFDAENEYEVDNESLHFSLLSSTGTVLIHKGSIDDYNNKTRVNRRRKRDFFKRCLFMKSN